MSRPGVAAVVDPRRDVDIYLEAARADGPADQPRRRDAPPQRLRVGRSRARGADRGDARDRRGRGARLRAPARARRRDVRRRDAPLHGARHAGPHAGARQLRASPTRRGPTSRSCCSPAARCWSARSGGPTCSARRTRVPYAGDDVPLAPRRPPAATRTSVMRLPDPRRRLALLDRDLVDAVVDDRLRAPPQPAAPADGGRCVRAGCCSAASRAFPRYFARMRPMNQAGPPLLGGVVPEITPLSGDGLDGGSRPRGARSSTARSPRHHAREHIPGSLSIPAGSSFGTWLGWVVDPDRPIVLLVERHADLGRRGPPGVAHRLRAVRSATSTAASRRGAVPGARSRPAAGPHGRQLAGAARGGRAGGAVRHRRPPAVRVRGRPRPGLDSTSAAGELPDRLDRLPRDRPIATICASGYRSSVAASMLRAAGFEDVASVANGLPTWEAHGFPVDYGPEAGSVDRPAATAAAGETHTH